MRLYPNDLRDIMLEIEEKQEFNKRLFLNDVELFESFKKIGEDQFFYTLMKLKEANFISFSYQSASDLLIFESINSITYQGHQFIDNIRDDNVWKKTLHIVSDFSSVSTGIISSTAGTVLSSIIKSKLGLS